MGVTPGMAVSGVTPTAGLAVGQAAVEAAVGLTIAARRGLSMVALAGAVMATVLPANPATQAAVEAAVGGPAVGLQKVAMVPERVGVPFSLTDIRFRGSLTETFMAPFLKLNKRRANA